MKADKVFKNLMNEPKEVSKAKTARELMEADEVEAGDVIILQNKIKGIVFDNLVGIEDGCNVNSLALFLTNYTDGGFRGELARLYLDEKVKQVIKGDE